jgi:PIN domain nuclease of toxin-antitoxin system
MIVLDTMALLYFLGGSEKLPKQLRREILDASVAGVPAASIWEIGIKGKSGRLDLDGKLIDTQVALEEMVANCKEQNLEIIAITPEDVCCAPFLGGAHKDPFDRMIVAQALERNATLISSDATLDSLSPALRRRWAEPERRPPARE